MKNIQNIVYKFMEREEVTLKQALLQASLGLSSKSGEISETVRGVVFNGYPYTEERKKKNAEQLGEMLFYWVMLASTTDVLPEDIISQFIASYLAKNKIKTAEEVEAEKEREKLLSEGENTVSILSMLKYVKANEKIDELTPSVKEMGKHVKSEERVRGK
jgi:NTP pyrophosphatase (non-canonical NTP hydrolase)